MYNPPMPSVTFNTYDDSLRALRNQGMHISNPRSARAYLESFSAYNVINGYADIFRDPNNPGRFKPGASFSELKALHHFDEGLRRCLTHYVLRVESVTKSHVTYEFCAAKDSLGSFLRGPCDYLQVASYDPTNGTKVQKLINDLSLVIASGSVNPGPIKDYINQGINPPPIWVLATGMSFGNTLKFFQCLLPNERSEVARSFALQDDVFGSFLMVLRDFRNALAHSNRVFCFRTVHRPRRIVRPNGVVERAESAAERKFGSVLFILSHLLDQKDFKAMANELSTLCAGLSKKLETITISDVAAEMGMPSSMRQRYGIRIF